MTLIRAPFPHMRARKGIVCCQTRYRINPIIGKKKPNTPPTHARNVRLIGIRAIRPVTGTITGTIAGAVTGIRVRCAGAAHSALCGSVRRLRIALPFAAMRTIKGPLGQFFAAKFAVHIYLPCSVFDYIIFDIVCQVLLKNDKNSFFPFQQPQKYRHVVQKVRSLQRETGEP